MSTDATQLNIFELGKITIGGKDYWVEEISVNASRDLHQYYTTDSFTAKAVRPGRQKVDFTIKKAKELSDLGSEWGTLYEGTTSFDMTLFALNVGDNVNTPQQIMVLRGCRLSKDNLGNFDSSKPVQQDLEGQAMYRDFSGGQI
jgi:hypothetical protein